MDDTLPNSSLVVAHGLEALATGAAPQGRHLNSSLSSDRREILDSQEASSKCLFEEGNLACSEIEVTS